MATLLYRDVCENFQVSSKQSAKPGLVCSTGMVIHIISSNQFFSARKGQLDHCGCGCFSCFTARDVAWIIEQRESTSLAVFSNEKYGFGIPWVCPPPRMPVANTGFA